MNISRKEALQAYCQFIKAKTKDDVCWGFGTFKEGEDVYEYGLITLPITQLNNCMKGWREDAKKGELFIEKHHSGSGTTFDGNEWYYLIINVGRGKKDPYGYFLFDLKIYGEMLFFKHKSNRDKVQEYVMRGLES